MTYYKDFSNPAWAAEYALARANLGHNVRRAGEIPGKPPSMVRVFFSPGRVVMSGAVDVTTLQPAEVGRR